MSRPVGNGDHVQVGSYPKHCVELCAEHRLQGRLLRLGHAREGDGIEPLALGIVERQRRTACLLIPCRPAWRERSRVSARFASATITPSSETATATASSGTTAASRNLTQIAPGSPPRAHSAPWASGLESSSTAPCCPTHPATLPPPSASSARPRNSPGAPPAGSNAPAQSPPEVPSAPLRARAHTDTACA